MIVIGVEVEGKGFSDEIIVEITCNFLQIGSRISAIK